MTQREIFMVDALDSLARDMEKMAAEYASEKDHPSNYLVGVSDAYAQAAAYIRDIIGTALNIETEGEVTPWQ